jgi:hypothetical protein
MHAASCQPVRGLRSAGLPACGRPFKALIFKATLPALFAAKKAC